jgi:hypothetical protein
MWKWLFELAKQLYKVAGSSIVHTIFLYMCYNKRVYEKKSAT